MKLSLKSTLKIVIVGLLLSGFVLAQDKGSAEKNEPPEKIAQKAAENWMPLWDSGKYDESYEELAEFTKKKYDKRKWFIYWTAARKPLGELKTRKLVSAEFITSLKGIPDQEGVVLQYKSSFEKKDVVLETFALIHEKDGTWRISFYLTD